MPLDYLLQATDKCPAYHLTYPQTQAGERRGHQRRVPRPHGQQLVQPDRHPGLGDVATAWPCTSAGRPTTCCASRRTTCPTTPAHRHARTAVQPQQLRQLPPLRGRPAHARGSIGDTLLRDVMVSVLNKMRVDLHPNACAALSARERHDRGVLGGPVRAAAAAHLQRARHDHRVAARVAAPAHCQSPFLLPPYATVMSLELRKEYWTSMGLRYMMGWRIGAPVEEVAGSGEWELEDGHAGRAVSGRHGGRPRRSRSS